MSLPFDPQEDAANYPSLRDDFVATVRGHAILIGLVAGHVFLAFAFFRLDRWLSWEAMVVLWMEAPALAACHWMWRRQFVPVRWQGQVITGRRARRVAVGLALASLVLGWATVTADRHAREIREALASQPSPVMPEW